MKTIEELWDGYRRSVVPAGASRAQVVESRRAFYAGASATLLSLLDLSEGDDVTEADLRRVSDLHDELVAFSLSVGTEHEGQGGGHPS